jgi:hypothetical protein
VKIVLEPSGHLARSALCKQTICLSEKVYGHIILEECNYTSYIQEMGNGKGDLANTAVVIVHRMTKKLCLE